MQIRRWGKFYDIADSERGVITMLYGSQHSPDGHSPDHQNSAKSRFDPKVWKHWNFILGFSPGIHFSKWFFYRNPSQIFQKLLKFTSSICIHLKDFISHIVFCSLLFWTTYVLILAYVNPCLLQIDICTQISLILGLYKNLGPCEGFIRVALQIKFCKNVHTNIPNFLINW